MIFVKNKLTPKTKPREPIVAKQKWNKELLAKIIARAWKDENFRNQLINNPKATFKALGIDLPAHIDLKIVCDDPTHLHLVIPASPSKVSELSQHELHKMAAGEIFTLGEGHDSCPLDMCTDTLLC